MLNKLCRQRAICIEYWLKDTPVERPEVFQSEMIRRVKLHLLLVITVQIIRLYPVPVCIRKMLPVPFLQMGNGNGNGNACVSKNAFKKNPGQHNSKGQQFKRVFLHWSGTTFLLQTWLKDASQGCCIQGAACMVFLRYVAGCCRRSSATSTPVFTHFLY